MDWVALAMAFVFAITFAALTIRQHDAFHTFALDLAKFDQAIWNTFDGLRTGTLQGRFLFSTLQNQSILANHFSPIMALLAPLFWVWSNVRVFFVVQAVGLAVAGLFLYAIPRKQHPLVALGFLLAFYLNPALHEVALVEFRRITLAVPFLAMAYYGLYARRRSWMAVGLICALLCKEDVALLVLMVGVYLLVFERDWRWGAPAIALGIAWALAVTFWVIPSFAPAGDGSSLYPQMNTFCLEGETYGEMVAFVMRDPLFLVRRMLDREGLLALWRVFFPMGLVLPFLAPDWLLLVLPSLAMALMSCMDMHKLTRWYSASVLPGLFAAVAVGLSRRVTRWAHALVVLLASTAVVGYALYSQAPLGGRFERARFELTEHSRMAAAAVAAVPDDARVAAQDPYVPHLAHREHIYLYPWISGDSSQIDYILLDRVASPYPLLAWDVERIVDEMASDVRYTVALQSKEIYLFQQGGSALPAVDVDQVVDRTMQLERVEIAPLAEDGFYRPVAHQPVVLRLGQEVRVSLYWQALAAPEAERTVSVRLVDASGALVGQYDGLPGRAKKPSSWWQEGWRIRDVYDLALSSTAKLGPGRLELLVYDTFSGEPLSWDNGTKQLHVSDLKVVQP
jgi:uncharacterized membrane protein